MFNSDISMVRLIDVPTFVDERGSLTAVELDSGIPFPVLRVFFVHDVTPGMDRGGHAHLETDQVVMASSGSLNVVVRDGRASASWLLSRLDQVLYVPRGLWIDLQDFSSGAVCTVLASDTYNPGTSLRTWEEYVHTITDSSTAFREQRDVQSS